MKIIVQKFGGTSVANQSRREMVANKVIEAIENDYSPVVVVSAIGRKGDAYATDTLLSLIDNDFIQKREKDLLMSCGEIISAVVMSNILEGKGYKTRVLTGGQAGIITNDKYGDADILDVDTQRILKLLSDGVIPIVTGFQGTTEENDFTTLGRGGSDVTGAVLGEALNAEFIEIYTDVDGIMTADPRIVSDASVINKISYNEVFQFAEQGAKVIHPRAVEYAMRGNVPLLIKNTLTDSKGTIITSARENSNRIITGVTHMSDRVQISVNFKSDTFDFNDEMFDILAKNQISIDLINVFPHYKVFTIGTKDLEETQDILDKLELDYNIITNCSKIAIIGNGMRGIPGVMAKILRVLSNEKIKVLQTADSHNTIWCLVHEKDTNKAINVLHKEFSL